MRNSSHFNSQHPRRTWPHGTVRSYTASRGPRVTPGRASAGTCTPTMRTLPLHAWVLLAAHSAAQEPPSDSSLEEAPVDEKWRCYAARHPDLRAGYCTNPGELKTCNWGELADHWATHGYDEGRHVECHSWDTECYLTRYPDIYEGARALRLPRTVPRSHDGSRARRLLPQHRQRHVREVRVGANPRAHGGRGAGGGPRRVGVRHQVRRSRLARVAARPGAPPTPHAPRAQGSALLRASVPRSARGLLRGRRRVVRLDPPR